MLKAVSATQDWFTRTAKGENERTRLSCYVEEIKKTLSDAGIKTRPLRFLGYEGHGYNYVQWGERGDSSILVAKGNMADILALEEFSQDDGYTRVDFAVTVELHAPNENVAKMHAEDLSDGTYKHGRTYYPVFVQNLAGGQTFYIGSREKSYLLRVYDRGAKSGEAQLGLLWRYEVQVNRESCSKAVKTVYQDWSKRREVIQSWVYDVFLSWGVHPLFERVRNYPGAMGLKMERSNPEKTVGWLRSSVRPALQRLIDEGWEDQARDALGLSQPSLL